MNQTNPRWIFQKSAGLFLVVAAFTQRGEGLLQETAPMARFYSR
jgi:hypothetical protein